MSPTKPSSSSAPPSVENLPGEPLLTHEKSLTDKVAKGSEAGNIVDQQILWLGTQLVIQFNVLIKTSRIHGRTNAALNQPVNSILTLVKTLAQEKPVTLRVQNDFLFLDESHLKVTAQQIAVFMGVIDILNAWHIGAISFASTVESKDLRAFAHVFVSMDPVAHSFDELKEKMVAEGVQGIDLEAPKVLLGTGDGQGKGKGGLRGGGEGQGQGQGDQLDAGGGGAGMGNGGTSTARGLGKRCYGDAVGSVGELVRNVKDGGTISFKHAKRAIQNIVDLMLYDESVLLGLTNLRCHDEYTHNHSVNVALLSVALGNRVGYPKIELADLGLAALFHDMGKSSIPSEILNKPGEFTEADWQAMRNHPTEGVLSLTRLRGITGLPGRMAAAAFEHHMNYDFSGYPKITVPWKQSLTGRILTIADCYDAMTSSRVYRREPIPPERVLKLMLAKAGQAFDPLLLKLFVTCVGLIPIGTLVLLDTNELAVVTKVSKEKENAERPTVRVITDTEGTPIDGPEIDLARPEDSGTHQRSILRLVDNTEYRFDTGRYFL